MRKQGSTQLNSSDFLATSIREDFRENTLQQYGQAFHGGNIANANRYFGFRHSWIDLSSAVSPWSYPDTHIDHDCFNQLPYDQKILVEAAADFYRVSAANIIPVSGAQTAIRWLPFLVKSKGRVALPKIGYQEHRVSWELSGHDCIFYSSFAELLNLLEKKAVDHVVLIQPNNPTAKYVAWNAIEQIVNSLSKDGIVVVDESFDDVEPDEKTKPCGFDNIIRLKSFGKFFGLPGLRLGFVVASTKWLSKLRLVLEPWSVHAAAITIGSRALNDVAWQKEQRLRIKKQSSLLYSFLLDFLQCNVSLKSEASAQQERIELKNGKLFVSLFGQAHSIDFLYEYFGRKGIYTRISDHPADTTVYQQYQKKWLRLGLPGDHFKQFIQLCTEDQIQIKNMY